MLKRRRIHVNILMACAVLLLVIFSASPLYANEAGHTYSVARERLENLRKSKTKKKYRSYWIDSVRSFELIEKKYPGSSSAEDACFERAGVYESLYRYSRNLKDLDEAIEVHGKCQSLYPRNARAPEALFSIIMLTLDKKKDKEHASELFGKLSRQYPHSKWTKKAGALLNISDSKAPSDQSSRSGQASKTPGVVEGIRHWSGGAYTRVVIDQNKPVAFESHALKKPDRLVFDLDNARLGPSLNREPLPINDGILKQVRASQYKPGIVRVVLDLESVKNYVAFPLHDPERLVIDITGESAPPNRESEPGSAAAQAPAAGSAPNDKTILSLSRQMGLKIRTIAIDAGHGGHDPGAIGRNGLQEKDVTLDIARRLAVLVREGLGYEVIMTRDQDVFIPLEQRPFIAKSKGADLFVSIHVNANRKQKARGIETYIQGLQASDREAMATAARENAMSTKKLSDLDSEIDRILEDLKQDNKLEESLQLAHTIQASLIETVKPVQKEVVNLGVKRAFFYVLINTQMPSILAEVGFISNPAEERQLGKESYRQKIAEALYEGVKKYVDSRSPRMMGI